MNIRATLINHYSKKTIREVAKYADQKPTHFKQLMEVFLGSPYRISQRAAIPVELCVKKNNDLLTPYFSRLFSLLKKESTEDSLKRNILRTLQYVEVPNRYKGKILSLCFAFLADPKAPIAVRVFSMTVAANISSKLPEIKNELLIVIKDRLPYESAGFVSRGKKILQQVNRK
jgi:hypothetical protein